MKPAPLFFDRLAVPSDMPELKALMRLAIEQQIGPLLGPERTTASFALMGVDSQLIADGTYFAVTSGTRIVGYGGWSRRATLFGGDHTSGRDARLLDPANEPARIRAMYTHPEFARQGIGRRILELCERAAAKEGFTSLELAATVSGEPLYSAYGFSVIERLEAAAPNRVRVPLIRMSKAITDRSTSDL